jgi:hypothetical protein
LDGVFKSAFSATAGRDNNANVAIVNVAPNQNAFEGRLLGEEQ